MLKSITIFCIIIVINNIISNVIAYPPVGLPCNTHSSKKDCISDCTCRWCYITNTKVSDQNKISSKHSHNFTSIKNFQNHCLSFTDRHKCQYNITSETSNCKEKSHNFILFLEILGITAGSLTVCVIFFLSCFAFFRIFSCIKNIITVDKSETIPLIGLISSNTEFTTV